MFPYLKKKKNSTPTVSGFLKFVFHSPIQSSLLLSGITSDFQKDKKTDQNSDVKMAISGFLEMWPSNKFSVCNNGTHGGLEKDATD